MYVSIYIYQWLTLANSLFGKSLISAINSSNARQQYELFVVKKSPSGLNLSASVRCSSWWSFAYLSSIPRLDALCFISLPTADSMAKLGIPPQLQYPRPLYHSCANLVEMQCITGAVGLSIRGVSHACQNLVVEVAILATPCDIPRSSHSQSTSLVVRWGTER